jgi:hypothetical protein
MAIANSPTSAGPGSPGQATQLQLHDIHVPELVSNFPIAPGWWLLLALIVMITVWTYKKINKNKRLNNSKNQALTVLENNPSMSAKECITLLKWAAMQYVSRQQLAKLHGDNFQKYLVTKLPEKYQISFIELSTAAFRNQYQSTQLVTTISDIDSDCQQATKLWLMHALPITKSTPSSVSAEEQKELSA